MSACVGRCGDWLSCLVCSMPVSACLSACTIWRCGAGTAASLLSIIESGSTLATMSTDHFSVHSYHRFATVETRPCTLSLGRGCLCSWFGPFCCFRPLERAPYFLNWAAGLWSSAARNGPLWSSFDSFWRWHSSCSTSAHRPSSPHLYSFSEIDYHRLACSLFVCLLLCFLFLCALMLIYHRSIESKLGPLVTCCATSAFRWSDCSLSSASWSSRCCRDCWSYRCSDSLPTHYTAVSFPNCGGLWPNFLWFWRQRPWFRHSSWTWRSLAHLRSSSCLAIRTGSYMASPFFEGVGIFAPAWSLCFDAANFFYRNSAYSIFDNSLACFSRQWIFFGRPWGWTSCSSPASYRRISSRCLDFEFCGSLGLMAISFHHLH